MLSSKQTLTSPSGAPAPVTSDQPSSSTPLFGLSAVIIPAPSAKPESQLQNCSNLWTSISSAGERLPLSLDSCCSVSLVSKVHADFVASKRPELKYCSLEERIFDTAADLKSIVKAPATVETNTKTVFTMLVVRGPVLPILFGENHLHASKALVIDDYVPVVTFRHPSMQFCVQYSLGNPFKDFPSVLARNASLSQKAEKQGPSHTSV